MSALEQLEFPVHRVPVWRDRDDQLRTILWNSIGTRAARNHQQPCGKQDSTQDRHKHSQI
jgi:hypothetical protein